VLDADVDTLTELYSPDLAYSHTDGKLDTREQYLAPLAAKLFRYTATERSDVQYRDHGDAVVITGRLDLGVEAGGRQFDKAMRFTAVWSRTGGNWQLIAWHANELAT
jgi:ketosteroid isomerase-like protein